MLSRLAAKSQCPVVYCNLEGGNDELVSLMETARAFNGKGGLLAEGKMFAEDFIVADLEPRLVK